MLQPTVNCQLSTVNSLISYLNSFYVHRGAVAQRMRGYYSENV